jgi:hypothetical protein
LCAEGAQISCYSLISLKFPLRKSGTSLARKLSCFLVTFHNYPLLKLTHQIGCHLPVPFQSPFSDLSSSLLSSNLALRITLSLSRATRLTRLCYMSHSLISSFYLPSFSHSVALIYSNLYHVTITCYRNSCTKPLSCYHHLLPKFLYKLLFYTVESYRCSLNVFILQVTQVIAAPKPCV